MQLSRPFTLLGYCYINDDKWWGKNEKKKFTIHLISSSFCVASACPCRLVNGQYIQMLTALVLQLIQCTVTVPDVPKDDRVMSSDKSKEGGNYPGDNKVRETVARHWWFNTLPNLLLYVILCNAV